MAKSFHTGPDRLPNTDTRSALASFVTLASKKAQPVPMREIKTERERERKAATRAHPPDEFSRCSLAITAGSASRVIKNDGANSLHDRLPRVYRVSPF